MAFDTIGVGTTANDGTGNTLRASMQKINANFALISSTSSGEGASLVGVEDSAGLFSAANVEAVLAEIQQNIPTGDLASLDTVGPSEIDDDAVTFDKLLNATGAGFIGATGPGAYSLRTPAQLTGALTDTGLSPASSFTSGVKIQVYEGNVSKIVDYDDLPSGGGGSGFAQSALWIAKANVGGTANAITLSYSSGPALSDGLAVIFLPGAANTDAVTIDYKSSGAVALVDYEGGALTADALSASEPVIAQYDSAGPVWRLIAGDRAQFFADIEALAAAAPATKDAANTTVVANTTTYKFGAGLGVVQNGGDADQADVTVGGTGAVLSSGFKSDSFDGGAASSGTYTPDPQTGEENYQHYTNNGAHTLAPPTNPCSVVIEITNGAAAGAITTSGFTAVDGDAFTTTNGDKFMCFIQKTNAASYLSVKALQ